MTFPLKSLALGVAALLASCVVQSSRPPIQGGDGIDVDTKTGAVSLDTSEVPLLPTACGNGQVVSHTDAGWACVTLTYSDISEAPAVDWTTVSASVTSTTPWLGTIPYAQITDAPADLGALAEDVTALQTSTGTLQTDVSALQTAKTTDEGNISTLQTSVSALQSAKTTDEGNISTLQTSVSALQTAKTTDEGHITTLQGQVSTLQTNATTDEGHITTAQSNISTLQSSMTTAQSNISTLQTAKTTDEGNITTLQTKVTTLQGDAAATRTVVLTATSEADGGTPGTFLVSGQVTDLNGANVSAQVYVHVKTLAKLGQGSIAVTTGTSALDPVSPTAQTSEAVIQTTATGAFTYEVTDSTSPDTVWTEATPSTNGLVAGTLLTF